jgi:8-oxo-dGTP diphosphatase
LLEKIAKVRRTKMRLAVDLVIFTIIKKQLNILMITRGNDPFKGATALPGGAVEENEGIEFAARRELEEETGLKDFFIEQLFTFGEDPKRDPRNRVVSVAYYALVSQDKQPKAGDDAADAFWIPVKELAQRSIAFDHDDIIAKALERIKGKIIYCPIAYQLLPEEFTLTQLQEVYEIILEKKLDKRNFRKYVLQRKLVASTKKTLSGKHRPAELFKFNPKAKSLQDFMIPA